MRTAGFFFAVSALFELTTLTSPVVLFGDLRAGPVAVVYHLLFAAAFATVGVGLWRGATWAPAVVFATTGFYSLDRVLYLADDSGREAELHHAVRGYEHVLDLIDPSMLTQMTDVVTITSLLCWWGFAAYIYARRKYFAAEQVVRQ